MLTDDLTALGQFTAELAAMESSSNLYSMDEERMGLDFAMLSMKTDALRKSGNISDDMSGTIQRAANGYMNAFLNRMDERMQKARETGQAVGDTKGFASLNKDAVWRVYSHTMQYYQSIGNALQAFQKGATLAQQQRMQNATQTRGIYRYANSASYWDNLFRKDEDKNDAYQAISVMFNNYAAGWHDFSDSLNGKDTVRFNLTLHPANFYGNSNHVDARA